MFQTMQQSFTTVYKKFFCENYKKKQANCLFFLLFSNSFVESFNTTACVNNLLFSCKERMAFVANVNFHFLSLICGAGCKSVSACTGNFDLMIVWVDIFFHFFPPYCCLLTSFRSTLPLLSIFITSTSTSSPSLTTSSTFSTLLEASF